jgi:predicted GNAT superfamily acetyltransferase
MAVMPDWWDGRDLRTMLPRLFLVHFNDTSFIPEDDGDLVAFLVGFMSPSRAGDPKVLFVKHLETR